MESSSFIEIEMKVEIKGAESTIKSITSIYD